MSRARSFLYMVVNHYRWPKPRSKLGFYGELEEQKACVYSVRRIDPSTLFHREDQPQAAPATEKTRLPPPITTFGHPVIGFNGRTMEFMLFGRARDKILAAPRLKSPEHKPVLYDLASRTSCSLPGMSVPKCGSLWLAVGDDLYVMEDAPLWWEREDDASSKNPMEALVQAGKNPMDRAWHLLPAPPYVPPPPHGYPCDIVSTAAVVGDSHIWVSSKGQGTFFLDTETRAWSKAADWDLPFQGQVQHAPEHGLWYGFSARDKGVLCAADLSSLVSTGEQPVPRPGSHELDMGIVAPEGRTERQDCSCLVHLDGGRFCVANYYSKVVMLTGMEVERRGEVLHLIKHKSCIYPLRGNCFECLL
ncbi:hypothetical protein CFC21_044550 [Triticum aestivum]|uniref:DUF1618 domain-containing protein n=2 Tax=Triticum aestivum TaxID=4565 RepID=A0A3B6G1V6_WHEAT|nr:hypothetical protein CFC21_044550 [Triticum aestivum]